MPETLMEMFCVDSYSWSRVRRALYVIPPPFLLRPIPFIMYHHLYNKPHEVLLFLTAAVANLPTVILKPNNKV